MTRAENVERVRDLAGPLGPFRSLADQQRLTDGWLDSRGLDAIDDVIELIVHPPTAAELRGTDPEEFSDVLGELLCRAAQLRPAESVPVLARQLADERVRHFAADALAATRSVEAQRALLASAMTDPDLAEDPADTVVDAVLEIGGSGIADLLDAALRRLGDSADARAVRHRIEVLLGQRGGEN